MQTTGCARPEVDQDPIVVTELDRRRLTGLIALLRERAVDGSNLDALELELERAETIDPHEVSPDVVTMNSTVELVDLDTRERMTLTVVYPGAANAVAGKVSVLAPVGLALLGARMGEAIAWRTPLRQRRAAIERVAFQPEASGMFEL